ncbi:MAG: UDP-N-acetylmuramate--L-alanine ligase [Oscillospiraceae bacterium]|jgi:UDP-N-acetylmuramate--alanine ligase
MLIDTYLVPGRRAHLVGIGGVSMRPLAEVLFGMGVAITGSDINESEVVRSLREKGIKVTIGHFAESVRGADLVIRTAAVHDDNPEIAEARRLGIPVFERAQAWGRIMKDYKNALCISGTHGKTTTTSMSAYILMEAGRDPTVMIGGTLPLIGSGYCVGSLDTIVMESCEYCNSFLSFFPVIAVILNVDADHLDFFKDIDDVIASFHAFAERVPERGCVIVNADDQNSMKAVSGVKRRIMTFGLSSKADVRAENIEMKNGRSSFDVVYGGRRFAHLQLKVPGLHNIMNALAATAAAIELEVPPGAIERGLAKFPGAGRRFEYKGEYNGAAIYDDYAHHPSEMRALITAAKDLDFKRIILVFQPHTYTRTKLLYDDFVRELRRADIAILAEIYAAREVNTIGITSSQLAKDSGARCYASFDEITAALQAEARPGDLILTAGAGDIYKIGEKLASLSVPQ